MAFRPCIDLRHGAVTQIVGGTLDADGTGTRVNFTSDRAASWYADLYRRDGLSGGHVIMLGPGNEAAAREALAAYPGGMQLGGGVTDSNAQTWLEAGASHVIVTSWLFENARFSEQRLRSLLQQVGKRRLVLDLSCRAMAGGYVVMTDRWRRATDLTVSPELLRTLAASCDEFLIHAVDVEGLCQGIDAKLVGLLADWSPIPVTYAGGAKSLDDLAKVQSIGRGRVDLTIGSALDIFGGTGVRYEDCVAFNRRAARP